MSLVQLVLVCHQQENPPFWTPHQRVRRSEELFFVCPGIGAKQEQVSVSCPTGPQLFEDGSGVAGCASGSRHACLGLLGTPLKEIGQDLCGSTKLLYRERINLAKPKRLFCFFQQMPGFQFATGKP